MNSPNIATIGSLHDAVKAVRRTLSRSTRPVRNIEHLDKTLSHEAKKLDRFCIQMKAEFQK